MSLAVLLLAAASAAAGDPLAEPACRAAMEALSTAEAAPQERAALQAAQRRAAAACLGTHGDPPQPGRRPSPPVSVPSAVTPAPTLRVPPPAPASPAPPRAMPPQAVISCDAATCLTSDGQRLPRSGGGVVAPQGPCRIVAGVLACP